MSLYFLQEKEPPHRIKLGYSKRPLARIAEISAGASQHLIVLKIMEGTKEDEQWLHEHFKSELGCRVAGKREWYEATAALLEQINSPLAIYPG